MKLFLAKVATVVSLLATIVFITAVVVFGYMGALYTGKGTNTAENVAILSFLFSVVSVLATFLSFSVLNEETFNEDEK